jgi:heme oxygenase (mycobilin-producing)
VISVTHFSGGPAVGERARTALVALAARPGYLRGTLARSTDDPDAWLLLTEWRNVGSYRRALGNYEVKLHATPLLADALDLPSGFEDLLDVAPSGTSVEHVSDREPLP